MRKTYHICFSSHDEVLYRTDADLIMGFNCLAEATLFTESRLLADGFMSTHWHTVVQTDDPVYFARRNRYAYTRYFNARYGRRGRFGEKEVFITEIDGVVRLMTALNYVNRQGLHHGLATTPFAYPHCSVNTYFRKELGKESPLYVTPLMPSHLRHRYLTRNIVVPEQYRMDENGLLLREDVIDTSYVEQLYITPRNFLFQMNKVTDEKTEEAQKQEKSVTVSDYAGMMTGESLQKLLSSKQDASVRTMLPKFKYDYTITLNDTLKALGMKDAFVYPIARFGKLNSANPLTFVDLVLHKTFIQVDDRGTKAGAVTMVAMADRAIDPREVKTVYLDRPFIYMILDNETNLPVFIGTVMHPTAAEAAED